MNTSWQKMKEYLCADCNRRISRAELEGGPIRCPKCGSYKIRKVEEEVSGN